MEPLRRRLTIGCGVAKGLLWESFPGYPGHFGTGLWDLGIQAVLRSVLAPKDVFYDIGSNAGFHAMVGAVLVGSEGRVHCFEPLPENVRVIRRQLALNRLEQCTVISKAVSNVSGQAVFYRHRTSRALGSCVPIQPASNVTMIRARCITINDFILANRIPDVVKIDVEGAEGLVLEGASALFSLQRPPVFIIELHSPAAATEVLSTLSEHDYVHTHIGGSYSTSDPGTEYIAQIVAVHREYERIQCIPIPENEWLPREAPAQLANGRRRIRPGAGPRE